MPEEMLILPEQTEIPLVESQQQTAMPAPTAAEQQAADAVFSDEANQAAAALLALQTGLGVLHNLALDTFEKPKQPQIPPRKKPEDEDR